ncbi:T9SS type A sorting domain-containing protein [Meridianimaribacter flavus]
MKIPIIQLETIDLEKVTAEDLIEDEKNEKATRFGIIIQTNIGFEQGVWETLENGDRLWRVHINPQNAKATNLYFDDFYMPVGATLHVYNPDKTEVLGGFGAHNNSEKNVFATALIYGEDIVVEYFEPAAVKNQGRLHISGVNHAYRMVNNPKDASDYGSSGDCEVNVNCSPEGDGKIEQRDASVRILVVEDGSTGWCSGTVMNNANFDCTPYLLTALHCLSDSSVSDLAQWVFYFNYQSTDCSNGIETEIPTQTVTGATLLANYNGADWALLELNSNIPDSYNVFYSGWDISENDFTGGYGIHHPAGDIKKVSTFSSTVSVISTPEVQSCREVYWDATTNGHGVTEGGSSGSGLFNNNGHLIGTLYGGYSSCSNTSGSDYYGNIAHQGGSSMTSLNDWLNPNNYNITSLDGAYSPCNVNNSELSSIDFPGDNICDIFNTIGPVVTIVNKSSTPLTSLIINYQFNSGVINAYNWSGSINQYQSESVTLPEVPVSTDGLLTLQVFTEMPNGSADSYPENDALTITSQPRTVVSLPYSEDFQAGNLPNNMVIYAVPSYGTDWIYDANANAFQDASSGSSIMMDNYNNDTRSYENFIETVVDLSAQTASNLSFDVAYARFNETFYDGLELRVSTDCGVTYTTLFSESGSTLATAPDASDFFVPNASQWATKTVDLSAYDGLDNLVLAFVNIGGYGQALYLDNILVESSETLSVANNNIENDLKVFPNPTSDMLTIKTSYDIDKVELYDMLGKRVMKKTNSSELNLNSLSDGIYLLEIYINNVRTVKRIIKQ